MSYTIQYSLGNITVVATTVNQQTSIGLPGQNFPDYGPVIDQNQISMLENFASSNSSGPANAIPGQTWFDSTTGVFKINVSTNVLPVWKPVVVDDGNITFDTVVAANAVIGNTTTRVLTTGGNAISGVITGDWTLSTGSTLQATYA